MAFTIKASLDKAAAKNIANKLEDLKRPMDSASARQLGKDVVAEMKALISKGISPLRGEGRFPSYKNPKDGYPASVRHKYPDKRTTPVNLYLTGKFLAALKSKVTTIKNSYAIEVGFFDSKEAIKEQGHREGANTQPKRPIIPNSGEQFAQRIQDIILKTVRDVVAKIIKQ